MGYSTELERKTEINRNIKLLLVGNSIVGKSSILRALKGLPFDAQIKSTHAISLEYLDSEDRRNPVKLQVWDLGGQEIYYGTHRIFMMSPSVQLVVFDSETESISVSPDRLKADEKVRNINLPFYISRIEELSPESSIIVVQNKLEAVPEFPLRLRYLYDKYPVYKVSALKNKNIASLKAQILEEARQLNIYGLEVPYYWEKVREYCENVLIQEKAITKERFKEICLNEKVLEEGIDDLLKYLHNTGTVYYKEDLENTIIIDQIWALKAIYKVFDRESKFYLEMREHSNGKCMVRTLFEDFDSLDDKYTIDEKWMFLRFIKSCSMCFSIKSNPADSDNLDTFYIFPEFLPSQKTDVVRLWELKNTKKQIWKKYFDFLPFYPLHTFISKYGCKTQHNFVWRNGILIYLNEQNFDGFLIEANFEDNYLQITIDEGIVDWLEIIKESIIVHGDYHKNLWTLIEGETVTVDVAKTERDLDGLTDVEQKINIGGLNSQRKGKLVISYAKEDLDEVKLLVKYLDAQKIDYWYDERLSSREAWDNEINREFNEASGYVIILSPDYMQSFKTFIHEKEVPIILEGYKNNKFATILNVKAFNLQSSSDISKINRYQKGIVMPNISNDNHGACDFIDKFVSEEILTKFL